MQVIERTGGGYVVIMPNNVLIVKSKNDLDDILKVIENFLKND